MYTLVTKMKTKSDRCSSTELVPLWATGEMAPATYRRMTRHLRLCPVCLRCAVVYEALTTVELLREGRRH